MQIPKVSVIMPVYNSEVYLAQAIDSILQQTFTDFELLIINDGSTDNSENIISAYTDHRIHYIRNDINRGLIYSLNKGIELSKGNYIARMDADDICFPERISRQVKWLEEHPSVSLTACHIININEKGDQTGVWELEQHTESYKDIKKTLPRSNCIAHPSILGKAGVLKTYSYASYQKNVEDYDLWLRLIADGHEIDKTPMALLYYRTHQQSITAIALKAQNISLKNFRCKSRYLLHRLRKRKFNSFDINVLLYSMQDLITGTWKSFKYLLKRTG